MTEAVQWYNNHAHNARIDDDRYTQSSMTETANSAVKHLHGTAVGARETIIPTAYGDSIEPLK